MSWQNVKYTQNKIAASAIAQYVVVSPDTTTDNQIVTAGSYNQDQFGVTLASTPTYGYVVPVAVEGVVKVYVCASTGAGARVAVGSSNGRVAPLVASGLATALGSALGAQGLRFSIGILQEARTDGEVGSLFIDPREVV